MLICSDHVCLREFESRTEKFDRARELCVSALAVPHSVEETLQFVERPVSNKNLAGARARVIDAYRRAEVLAQHSFQPVDVRVASIVG